MHFVGIDVGSSYLKIWQEDAHGRPTRKRSIHHGGSPQGVICAELSDIAEGEALLCFAGRIAGDGHQPWYQEGLLAEVDHLKDRYPQRTLLILGAEKIEYVRYDDQARILRYETNQACAAGTGSFLDEQLKRLGFALADLEHIPLDENAPPVASRCAVFAKTDLIHLQQAGHTREVLYNGLCKGLVATALKSIFGGHIPDGEDCILSGGLIANRHIRSHLLQHMPRATVLADPAWTRAAGLCRQARTRGLDAAGFRQYCETSQAPDVHSDALHGLVLRKSRFPETDLRRTADRFGNEVWHALTPGEVMPAYLGVDIGSTSTKAVLMDAGHTIRLDLYTRTAGDPIAATRRIFQGIQALAQELPFTPQILACGTTGSGRTLVGRIIGADLILNEITAHACGARAVDAAVETIFEIGGQDAKFIRLEGGRVADTNMNYVCAAGTGSFVEEQAGTLGMALDEIGEQVMGAVPLANSDRCTVFMNQEVTRQIAAGHDRARIMAGVLLAVFKNYLNRVVGPRQYARSKIVFQGATARNKGLVAALEQLTGAEIVVSPFCHVMGAYGAAILAKERLIGHTAFKGLDLPDVEVRETSCHGCENACRITVAQREGAKISWGYLCGREESQRRGRRPNPSLELVRAVQQGYQARIAAPRRHFKIPALALYEGFIPFWQAIAKACAIDIEVCYPDERAIRQELAALGTGDFCYPIKVAMAATQLILKQSPGAGAMLPVLIQEAKDATIHPRSLYCPFVTGFPGFHAGQVWAPVIDFSRSVRWQARQLQTSLAQIGLRGISITRLAKAVAEGRKALHACRQEVIRKGCALLDELPQDENVIVLLGRPYNLYHRLLNLGIPELIESLGYRVITMDILPDTVTNAEIVARFPDMYWYQGQRILRQALAVRRMPRLFPVMLSNFSCGPDSFILSFFEQICQGKPYLILELDEHGSATGYQTRIEAFLDMVAHYHATPSKKTEVGPLRIHYDMPAIRHRRLWIPQIHPYIPDLWAAMLNRHGYDARPLGEERQCDCDLGRSFCRGSECLPAALTIGRFIDQVRAAPHQDVLIMPRANGPCRYGQYATLHSQVLDRIGLDAQIFSPTSADGYAFFTPQITRDAWKMVCLGDMLYKLRCRTVPYHPHPARAHEVFTLALADLCGLIRQGDDIKDYLRGLVQDLRRTMDCAQPRKPLVGIVGEIFVRLNSFSNQHVTEVIEAAGGEAWLSPMSEWMLYVAQLLGYKESPRDRIKALFKRLYLHRVEEEIQALFAPLLSDRKEPPVRQIIAAGSHFIPPEFEGESILTLGRAKLFATQGVDLIVNCAPFGCMPGRITAFLFQSNPAYFEVPVVNLFFDGTGDSVSRLALYLSSLARGQAVPPQPAEPGGSAVFRIGNRSGGKIKGSPLSPDPLSPSGERGPKAARRSAE